MDVVFFIYGLAFVVMGLAIALRVHAEAGHIIPAKMLWLLAAFGFVHGLREWMVLWRIVHGDTEMQALARAIVASASFLPLFEFGRLFARASLRAKKGEWFPGSLLERWVYAPLLLGVILGTALAAQPVIWLELWARVLLCFPGATLAAFGFWRFRNHPFLSEIDESDARRIVAACDIASASFVAYGVLAGLLGPRMDVFPMSLVNEDAFLAVTGVPVQLGRTVCAIGAAVSVSTMLNIFNLELLQGLRAEVAERRRTERERTATLQDLTATLQSIGDGIITVDQRGRVTRMNPVAEALTGFSFTEANGRPIGEVFHIVHEASRQLAPKPIERVLGEGAFVDPINHTVLLAKDGAEHPIANSAGPIRMPDGDTVCGVVLVFRDQTEQHRFARERKRIEQDAQVSERLASIGLLAAGVAHEMNNPLNFVYGNLEYIWAMLPGWKSECATHDVSSDAWNALTESVRDARDGAERVRSIIADLKLLARHDDAQPLEEVDLPEVVRAAANVARHAIRYCARLVVEPATVPRVPASASRLAQVFLNLLTNAVDAFPRKDVARNEIRVRFSRRGTRVVVEIGDNGVGMSPETMARVFDPFFTTKPVGRGTGLGLAICRGILLQFDGTIEVESVHGQGSVFRVVLPESQRASRHPCGTHGNETVERKLSRLADAAKQIRMAIAMHIRWKARLHAAIESGAADFAAENAGDNTCEFGKWLCQDEAPDVLSSSPHWATVARLHDEFHATAAGTFRRALERGEKMDALRQLDRDSDFASVSTALIEEMMAWLEEISTPATPPPSA